jgi:hypothetical protein
MPLVTLASAPKAFTDPATALSQRNAIRSWKQLPEVEVLLFGKEDGLAAAAHEIGVKHSSAVALNQNGVPLVSSMLRLAREANDNPLLCIINADIILLPDFLSTARQILDLSSISPLRDGYLLLGRRWDLDVKAEIDFAGGWATRLRHSAHENGKLHRPTGSDLFIFPRHCYEDVPDFAIGRAGWDNWMIFKARSEGWPVVDATASMTVIHQNHDYRHLPGAQPHYDHPDTRLNTQLAGGQTITRYTVLDATHVLAGGRLERPQNSFPRFTRGLELLLRRVLFFLPENALESVVRPQRWSKRLKRFLGRAE